MTGALAPAAARDWHAGARQAALARLLGPDGPAPVGGHRVLEVGCGRGTVLDEVASCGRPGILAGIDIDADRLSAVDALCAQANAAALPFADGAFDLVIQATAFSSILEESARRTAAAEMARVAAPAGAIVWFDFRLNPANPATRGVSRAEVRRLFPGFCFQWQRVALAPPLLRMLLPDHPVAARRLEALRWGNLHHLGLGRRA